MLSQDDIYKAMAEGHLKIYPFEKENLTGIGYNLSTTYFAFSINRGVLLTVYQKTTDQGVKRYVVIPKNDTVLFFSKEYIEVDRTLAGTFHSKVSRVCQGVGRISTTLDPTWRGQLILSVDNPTSKDINFELDMSSGNIMTLLLYKLDTAVTGDYIHDNNQGRCDLLLKHFAEPLNDKKYKEKHLQLEKFVVGEFANSLNGYDQFIESDHPEDKYSQKIRRLICLKSRLEKDKILVRENRYVLGQNGEYHLFMNKDEEDLIQSCSLFNVKILSNKIVKLDNRGIRDKDISDVPDIIDQYMDIINYELQMINHIRRIDWQNEKISQFAGEDSELVHLRYKKMQRKLWGANIVFALVAILFFIILYYIIEKCFGVKEIKDLLSLFAAFYMPGLVLIWPSFVSKTKDLRSGIKNSRKS